jgi:hypothetical protein
MNLKGKFQGKRILFLSVQTFGLQKEIKNRLEELGAVVQYFDERPANNNFTKGIIRLNPKLLKRTIEKYYHSILKLIATESFDYFFLNRGEIVPEFFIKQFKVTNPNCETIFYTWDSFKNNPNPMMLLHYFNRKFTFDSKDAEKYDLDFRPLFYLPEFSQVKLQKSKKLYNLLFLGTAHSDRYKLSSKIIDWCLKNGLITFYYYYMQGRLVYIYKRLFDSSFKEFDYKKLSFKSLSKNQILDYYKVSDCILDIHHPGQNGLTMRTIEAIGAGRKLITTNKEIANYCFYNQINIHIIDREDIILDRSFFDSTYQDIDKNIYESLSLDGWLNSLFFEDESDCWFN